ncbi:hypothetical protein BCR33DRAFT_712370 [Rhizoclosmatium globosum]|uniref:Uncharacterized protein n=1 Tax=Rhizoclosmatium globosum TaxID=329046 RepID=A0A1Y2CY50_9FUNG|nr:hypothetical protein BCR33DRAFT_712370 [Rhizoclosmatium globosum]|eukprot:ORY51265.1 hypothetical protein BCR33DRAFT_712370 [Rhizoclosmatium globosum]
MDTFRYVSASNRRLSEHNYYYDASGKSKTDSLALILLVCALLASTMVLVNDGIVASYSTQQPSAQRQQQQQQQQSTSSSSRREREPVVSRLRRVMSFTGTRTRTRTQSIQQLAQFESPLRSGDGGHVASSSADEPLSQQLNQPPDSIVEPDSLQNQHVGNDGDSAAALLQSPGLLPLLNLIAPDSEDDDDDEDNAIHNISGIQELDDLDDVLDATIDSNIEDDFSSDDEDGDEDEEDDDGPQFINLDNNIIMTGEQLDTKSIKSVKSLTRSHSSLTNQQIERETELVDALTVPESSAESSSSATQELRKRRLFPSISRLIRSQNGSNASSTISLDTSETSATTPPTWRAATSRRLRNIPRRIRRNVGNVATATTAGASLVAIGAVLLLAVLWIVKMRGWSWLPKFWQLVSRRGANNG